MSIRAWRLWFTCVFLLLAIGLAAAAEFPTPTGFVNDFAGVLDQGARTQLEVRLQEYARATTTEIAIAILPALGGRTIEDVSVRLFEQWRIGKRDKNNGILIVVAVQDRRARIEVGYGLEGKVPDAQAGRIIRDLMAPRFRQGDYAGGLTAAVDELVRLIGGTPGAAPATPLPVRRPARDPFLGLLSQAVIFVAILGASWWASANARPRCPRCRTVLQRSIARATLVGAASTSVRYVCPRCGYSDIRMEPLVIGPFWGGRGWSSGGFGGGGFGGFGGGSSGGGGASGSW